MFRIVERDDAEGRGGTSESDAFLMAGDGEDGAWGRVGTGDVPVVEVNHLQAVGAAPANDAVLTFAVVLKDNTGVSDNY